MSIEVIVEPEFARRIVRADLCRVAAHALRAERVSSKRDLAIVVVGDKTIRQLNRDFHGVNAPTDVLSFPGDDGDSLGDIIISYQTARANAHAAHWRTRDELELLVVHGVLHLLGYDDIEPEDRAQMWKRQEKIMGRKINRSSE